MAEQHICIQGDRINRLEDDVRIVEKEIDRKVDQVYTKYNGKIDALRKDIAGIDKKLSIGTMKLAFIIGIGSFFASMGIMLLKDLAGKALGL